MRWVRDEHGVYHSDCGRFSIRKLHSYQMHSAASRAFPWVLYDNQKTESDGKTPWSRYHTNLSWSKHNAELIAKRGYPVGGA